MKLLLLMVALASGSALPAAAAQIPPLRPYALDTGAHDNDGSETRLAYSRVLAAGDSRDVRVRFKFGRLGARSHIQLTSLADGQAQKLDAANLKNWQNNSAYFNGARVRLDLFVAPGESGIRAVVEALESSCNCLPAGPVPPGPALATLCGADNRVGSGDNRVGRTTRGCTAWLISNGGVLSAGHCVPNGAVFMVNIPASLPDGTLRNSAPDDQYPIVAGSEVSVWDNNGTPANAGDDIDYVIFRLNPDNLGRRAHERLGFFRVTTTVPGAGAIIRLTGVGNDSTPPGTTGGFNAQNQTLQTSTGGFGSQQDLGQNSTGRILRHLYAVDSEPGNSGSPIIWEANGFAIGVHTAGGCASNGSGANSGTSFNQANLAAAVENFPGANTRYLDTVVYPGSPADTGSIFAPAHNLRAAYQRTPHGGIISIVAGAYPRASAGNAGVFGADGKTIRLQAPVGPVTIGQ